MMFRLFISLLDPQDADKLITFFKRRKYAVGNFLSDSSLALSKFDQESDDDDWDYPKIFTDNSGLGSAMAISLTRTFSDYNFRAKLVKIINDLKESPFPYFMAVVSHQDGYTYVFEIDHSHLISKANNHFEVKKVTEIVEVVKEVIKEVPADEKKVPAKLKSAKAGRKVPARKSTSKQRAARR